MDILVASFFRSELPGASWALFSTYQLPLDFSHGTSQGFFLQKIHGIWVYISKRNFFIKLDIEGGFIYWTCVFVVVAFAWESRQCNASLGVSKRVGLKEPPTGMFQRFNWVRSKSSVGSLFPSISHTGSGWLVCFQFSRQVSYECDVSFK